MKRLAVMALALLLVTGLTYAQDRGGGERPSKAAGQAGPGNRGSFQQMSPEEMLKRQTQRLVDELKLSKDQEAKVLAINKKYMEKNPMDFSKMRDATDDERAKMREEMTKVQNEKNKEIRTVLTPDQAKLFDENLKKREEARKNGQGRNFGPGGPGGQQ